MLEFVLALGMMVIVLAAVSSFILWALFQWRDARKYRHLVKLKNLIPPEELRPRINKGSGKPRWKIQWRYKGKMADFETEADTEGEAVRNFLKAGQGQGFSSIVNITKL